MKTTTEITEYRAGRNFIRLGDIVKAHRPGKRAALARVTEFDADADGNVTGIFVTIVARLNGSIHPDYGKWRCLSPDLIERIAQTGPMAEAARKVIR